MLVLWFGLLAALVILLTVYRSGGMLTLAYFLGLSLIHVPGVLVFLDGGSGLQYAEETAVGFELTLLGMFTFLTGAIVAVRMHKRQNTHPRGPLQSAGQGFGRIGWRLVAAGFVAYFVFAPLSFSIPSLTGAIVAMGTLLVIGLWIELYAASATNNRRRTALALAAVPVLPFATVVSGGFISYGTYWALSVIAFLFVITRQRVWFYVMTPIVVVLGLSVFVTYMGERVGIRQVVQQQAAFSERLTRVSTIVTQFQILDLNSPLHRQQLNDRLNQNFLVGAGVMRHQSGLTDFAYGSTVPWWAPIPRAVWSDKPVVGGGGDVVAQYTGIVFGPETSVGVGQVLEFYINFGVPGVIVGFFGLGFLLMRLDRAITRAFAESDLRVLLLTAMPALNLLQPGGNLLEIVVGTLTAFLTAHALLYFGVFGVRAKAKSAGAVSQAQ